MIASAPTRRVPTVVMVFVAVILGVILGTATTTYASDGGNDGSVTINVNVPKHSSTTGPGHGSGPLPRTGADVIGLVGAAGALIGGGILLTVLGRRRRYR